jgi:hypothetical protein
MSYTILWENIELQFGHLQAIAIKFIKVGWVLFSHSYGAPWYYKSFIYSRTDPQLGCLKKNIKIYIKIYIKRAPTCFGVAGTPSSGSELVRKLVEDLRCKTEGRWLDFRCGNCDFSLTYSFRPTCESEVNTASDKSNVPGVSPWGQMRPVCGNDSLATSMCRFVYKLREPQIPGTLAIRLHFNYFYSLLSVVRYISC